MRVACVNDSAPAADPWRATMADAQRAAKPNTAVSLRAVAAVLRALGVRATLLVALGDAVVRCDAGDRDGPLLGALMVHGGHMSAAICTAPSGDGRDHDAPMRCDTSDKLTVLPGVLVGGDMPEPTVSGSPLEHTSCLYA